MWVAAFLSACWEIALFLLAFAKRIGRKSWAEIGPELETLLVSWIVNRVRDAFSRFVIKYRQRVYEEFNYFNVRGLTLLSAFTLDLNQVFVDLRVAPSSQTATTIITPLARAADDTNIASIWDFIRFAQRVDRSRKALAIIGPPGSGKTTLLQHIALTFSRNRHR